MCNAKGSAGHVGLAGRSELLDLGLSVSIAEDCADCFGAQKKDESNDREKKEEDEASALVHHSIIEAWDWGRQPGGLRLSCHSHLYF